MSIIGGVAGAALGIKLVNGNLRPKYNKKMNKIGPILFSIVFLIPLISFFVTLYFGTFAIFLLIAGIFCIVAYIYFLMILPAFQNPNNYYIEFVREDSMEGFKLYYKNKLINVLYRVDSVGKIAFMYNDNKLGCVSYADGSKMKKIDRYRIVNYFSMWLNDNDLLSKDVTVVFE